jgi:hypothetical protein
MKTVKLDLAELDGNAFALMGAFQRQARKEGWLQAEINEVLEECKSGDYAHLLYTLSRHCDDHCEAEDEERDPDGPFDSINPEEEENEDEC